METMVKTLGPYTPGVHSLGWKVQTEGSTEVEEALWEGMAVEIALVLWETQGDWTLLVDSPEGL